MLTRLEVDGFKNLLDFKVDFGPLTYIVGPNGVGKSNLFDAINFLSLLAELPLTEALEWVRGIDPNNVDPQELFWNGGATRAETMTFAAEMIVGHEVGDDYGRNACVTSTFLRYELELGLEAEQLLLRRESLTHINKGDAHRHLSFPMNVGAFREVVVRNQRRSGPYLSTNMMENGRLDLQVHGDGGSVGWSQLTSPDSVTHTAIGATHSAATPTLLAAKREMQGWRSLQFGPPTESRPSLEERGGHLTAPLHRITQAHGDEGQVFERVATRLAEFLPVQAVQVFADERSGQLSLRITESSGRALTARSLGPGMRRVLSLALYEVSPNVPALLCLEEPEDGIHPAKIPALVELLQSLVVDPRQAPGEGNRFRQLIVTTYSSHLVQLMDEDDILVATTRAIRGPHETITRSLELQPLVDSWRAKRREGSATSLSALRAFLVPPVHAPIQYELEGLRDVTENTS